MAVAAAGLFAIAAAATATSTAARAAGSTSLYFAPPLLWLSSVRLYGPRATRSGAGLRRAAVWNDAGIPHRPRTTAASRVIVWLQRGLLIALELLSGRGPG